MGANLQFLPSFYSPWVQEDTFQENISANSKVDTSQEIIGANE